MKEAFFSLQLLSETFIILRGTERDVITGVYWSSCKVPVILVRFRRNLGILDRVSKNSDILIFMKIRPMGTELFLADGQTYGQTWRS